MKKYIFIFTFIMTGCVEVQNINTPSGNSGYLIECNSSMKECYVKASELCTKGYNINSKTDLTFVSHGILVIDCK